MALFFDDVPDSAAPDKNIVAALRTRELSRTPSAQPVDDYAEPARPSLDSPYKYTANKEDNGNAMTIDRNGVNPNELPPLQAQSNLDLSERDGYEPVTADDPTSYDLVPPGALEDSQRQNYSLEKQSLALFSKEHLQVIFANPGFLLRFTSFLGIHRPSSVPILVHYLDSLKALRAIHYANAILEGLDPVSGLDFTKPTIDPTKNEHLLARANEAFDHLVKEELPSFITYEYIQVVSASISQRISGLLAPHLREASEGLAEVFCLTDPSRPDNPIVFASEEFNRTTQYGMSYILGRNCRFLQGPHSNPLSVNRLREAVKAGKQHQEVFLNYRRDGSPFMNLLMMAPLCDSRGIVRYFIGAQVDVSGLVKDCSEMPSLQALLDLQNKGEQPPNHQLPDPQKSDELRELAEMLNQNELATIRRYGGKMHKDPYLSDDEDESDGSHPRLLIKDPQTLTPPLDGPTEQFQGSSAVGRHTPAPSVSSSINTLSGRLTGVYQHYLLVRPYPSLRILFASPSQRLPGILQSPFMNKIGGSQRVRDELTAALAEGRGVTAKVRWVTKHDEEGRNKWIHCTPLVGINGQIGVWMVVVVDDERHRREREQNRGGYAAGAGVGRMAPPVQSVGGYADTAQRGQPQGYNVEQGPKARGDKSAQIQMPPEGYNERSRGDSFEDTTGGSVNSFRI